MDSEKEEMNQTDIAALHHFYSRHISNLPDEQALTELFAQVSMKKHQKAVWVVGEPMDPKTKMAWRRHCSVYLYRWDCYINHFLPSVSIIFHYFNGTKHISAWHHYTALVCLFLTVNSVERWEACSTAGLKWWRFRLQLVVCTLTWTPWRIVSNQTDAAALFLGCFGELIHRATLSTDHIDCGCFKTSETLIHLKWLLVPCSYGSTFPKHLIIHTWTRA